MLTKILPDYTYIHFYGKYSMNRIIMAFLSIYDRESYNFLLFLLCPNYVISISNDKFGVKLQVLPEKK